DLDGVRRDGHRWWCDDRVGRRGRHDRQHRQRRGDCRGRLTNWLLIPSLRRSPVPRHPHLTSGVPARAACLQLVEWNRFMLKHNSEKGAVAILASAALILVLGIAAFAIDLGLGFSERRGDQTAAHVAAMAGAVETLGSNATIRDYILDFAERNVPSGSITVEQWASCTDPERATLNSSGHNFVPVAAPSGWPTSIIDCVSVDPAGYVRVNLPPQTVKTTFGRVLGVDELSTGADAIARITNRGGGGILPFGILATAGDGQHVCLRDNSAGLAEPPCDGGDQGNFGGLESPHYGNSELGTTKNCTGSPKKDVIAVNIAVGLDHRVVP